MKRAARAFVAVSVALSIFAVRAWAGGVTISLGANALYSAWQPPWGEGRTLIPPYYFSMSDPSSFSPGLALLNRSSVPMTINEFEGLHGPLAGPSLAVSFLNRWSITSIFIAGKYITRSTGFVS